VPFGYPVLPDTSPFGVSLTVVSRLPHMLKEPRTIEELASKLQIDADTVAKLIAYLIRKGRVIEIAEQPKLKPLVAHEPVPAERDSLAG